MAMSQQRKRWGYRRNTDVMPIPDVEIDAITGKGKVIITQAERQLDRLEVMLDDYEVLMAELKERLLTRRGRR